MHELAIMEHVLDISVDFARRHDATAVTRIKLAAGSMSGMVPKWAEQIFRLAAKGTIAQEARLFFRTLPAALSCADCGTVTHFTGPMPSECGSCGSTAIMLTGGRELLIEGIEISVGQGSS